MAKEITTANFETEVLKSEKPVLIDFWATWCGPCMRQGPVVEELAEEGYAVGKVDVDQNMALAQQFRVVSIPVSYTHLSLAFKKHTGKSPTKYREEMQNT